MCRAESLTRGTAQSKVLAHRGVSTIAGKTERDEEIQRRIVGGQAAVRTMRRMTGSGVEVTGMLQVTPPNSLPWASTADVQLPPRVSRNSVPIRKARLGEHQKNRDET